MPELPEVETIKIGLASLLPGLTIASVQHDWPKSFPNAPADVEKFMIGAKITQVRRRAKVLLLDLSSRYSLLVHLKMTGQLVFVGQTRFGAGHPGKDLVGELPARSTRVTITFTNGDQLFFNDQRKFGWMKLLPTVEIPELDFFKRVGPEPLEVDFTSKIFIDRLQRRKNTSIKAAILDQTVLAGVGNIYADEALWTAKLYPATPVKDVSRPKLLKLHEAIQSVMRLSIEKGGSSDRNYVDSQGRKGSYLSFANVFRRNGQPCPRCGTTIEKIRVAGRGTHYCPHCQNLKRVED
jgi:formamidopyrimidine-DNA glycosylase